MHQLQAPRWPSGNWFRCGNRAVNISRVDCNLWPCESIELSRTSLQLRICPCLITDKSRRSPPNHDRSEYVQSSMCIHPVMSIVLVSCLLTCGVSIALDFALFSCPPPALSNRHRNNPTKAAVNLKSTGLARSRGASQHSVRMIVAHVRPSTIVIFTQRGKCNERALKSWHRDAGLPRGK